MAVALTATCTLTTLLVTAGLAAGAGITGRPELTLAALAVPATLVAWRVLRHRQRATTHRQNAPAEGTDHALTTTKEE